MAAKKEEGIQLQEIKVKHAKITIEGDGDLVLNKMNDVAAMDLINARKDKAKRTEKIQRLGRNHHIYALERWKTYRFLRGRSC